MDVGDPGLQLFGLDLLVRGCDVVPEPGQAALVDVLGRRRGAVEGDAARRLDLDLGWPAARRCRAVTKGGRLRERVRPGRPQLIGHARDDHAWLQEKPGLQPERALVMKQLLPPVPEHVFGDEHGDNVARALPAQPAHVRHDGLGDVPVRRGDDGQRHRQVCGLPFFAEPRGLGVVHADRDRLDVAGLGGACVGERPQRRQVQLGDQHDGAVAGRQRDRLIRGRRR